MMLSWVFLTQCEVFMTLKKDNKQCHLAYNEVRAKQGYVGQPNQRSPLFCCPYFDP